ncbi:hypothetical protein VPH35_104117 [Triticum aestivum]
MVQRAHAGDVHIGSATRQNKEIYFVSRKKRERDWPAKRERDCPPVKIPRFLSLSLVAAAATGDLPSATPSPTATSPPPRTRSSSRSGRAEWSGDGRRWRQRRPPRPSAGDTCQSRPRSPLWLLSQARRGVVILGREEGEQPTMLKAVRGGRKSRRRLQFEAAEDGGEDVEHVALRTREYSESIQSNFLTL